MSQDARKVWMTLWKTGCGVRELSRKTGIHTNGVQLALLELEQMGVIKRERPYAQRAIKVVEPYCWFDG